MYQFVVNFVGEVPEYYQFIYTILTLVLSLTFFGTFVSIFYWILKLVRGVI